MPKTLLFSALLLFPLMLSETGAVASNLLPPACDGINRLGTLAREKQLTLWYTPRASDNWIKAEAEYVAARTLLDDASRRCQQAVRERDAAEQARGARR